MRHRHNQESLTCSVAFSLPSRSSARRDGWMGKPLRASNCSTFCSVFIIVGYVVTCRRASVCLQAFHCHGLQALLLLLGGKIGDPSTGAG